jgi:hypothetical protein
MIRSEKHGDFPSNCAAGIAGIDEHACLNFKLKYLRRSFGAFGSKTRAHNTLRTSEPPALNATFRRS